MAGTAVASGRGIIANDYAASPLALAPFANVRQRLLAQPLLAGDRSLGVMIISREDSAPPFTEEDLSALADFATQTVVAIEKARLFSEAQRSAAEYQALFEVGGLVGSALDVDRVLDVIVDRCRALIGAGAVGVFRLDQQTGILSYARGVGLSPEFIDALRIQVGEGTSGRAVQEQAPVWSADLLDDPNIRLSEGTRVLVAREGYRAVLSVPLLTKSQTHGVLAVYWFARHTPTPSELRLLSALAGQAAVALENARLFAEARRSAAEYQALFEVGRLVASTLDVDRVLDLIVDQCQAVMGVRAAGIFRLDQESRRLVHLRGRGLSAEYVEEIRVRLGEGTAGRAIVEGGPAWSADVLSDPAFELPPDGRALVEREGYRAVLSVPILIKDEPYGILAVYWWEPHAPPPSEVGVLSALASQAGVALENARLYSAATARGKRLSALATLTETLTATLSLEDVLDRVVRSAVELFGSSMSHLWLVDEAGETLSQRAHAGTRAPLVGRTRFRVGEGLVGQIVAGRAPLVVPDMRDDPRVVNRDRVEAEGVVSFAGTPLALGDRLLGALTVSLRESRQFSDEDLSLLQSLANHAAIAIENARLFDEERSRKAYLAALLEINTKIGALAPTEALLTSIAEEAARLLALDNAGFRLLEGDELVVAGLAGTAGETMLRERIKVGESFSGKVVAEGRPILREITEVADLIPEHLAADRRLGYTHFMGVPLRVGERITGVLAFRSRRPLTTADLEIAEAFAGQAAIAIEHSRLYREAAEQAERMRAVADLGRTLVSIFEVGRILDIVTAHARETLAVAHAGVYLQDPETGMLHFARGGGFPDEFVRAHALEPGEGVAGRALAEGRPVWTSDILADPAIRLRPETRRRIQEVGTRAVLALPLLRERALGALVVYRGPGERFSDGEIEYCSVFASQVAVALENARLYEALDVRANRLRALARLTHRVSSSLDVDEVLGAIARAAADITGAPFASLYVADEVNRTLEFRVASDERMGRALPRKKRDFGEGLVGWVAEHRQPLEVPDVVSDDRALGREWAVTHGLRTFVGVPIVFQEALLGVLTLNDSRAGRLGPDDWSLLESFAGQAAVAIRNARLYADTRQRLAETRALLEVEEILNSTLEPKRLLKQAAIKIAEVLQVDRCTIERWEGDRVLPLMSQYADGRTLSEQWAAFTALSPALPREIPVHRRAIETRRPVVVADAARSDMLPQEWVERFSIKSSMVAPMIRQDEVIGVMSLDYTERVTPFEPWQADVAMAIAGQLALAVDNTRLYGEIEQRLKETTTLLAVGQALSRPGPTADVMRGTARAVGQAFSCDMVGVYVLDERKEALVPLAGHHVPKHLLELVAGRRFVLDRFRSLEDAWGSGRAFWSSDALSDPRFDEESCRGLPPFSCLVAPTPVRGEPVGAVILVWWGTGREFRPEEIRLAEGVASQIGLAMENAELARQTQLKLQETETLLSVSRTLGATLDPEQLARQFLRHVVQALGADMAGTWLLDESGEWLEPFAGYRVPPQMLERLRATRLSIREDAFYAEAARTLRAVVTTDFMTDPRVPARLREAAPHRTQLFVPIVTKDRLVGGFAVTWWERTHDFTDSELRLVEAIASQAGVALEHARLFRDNQRRLEELSVLHELSRAVTGQLEQAQVLDAIHRQVSRVLDARHMVIILEEGNHEHVEVALRILDGVADRTPPLRHPRQGIGLMAAVMDTRRPLRTDNYWAECARRGVTPVPGPATLRHWLGVPMMAGAETLGVLALRSADIPFSEADERLLANIAGLAALALRSARLYEERTRAYSELAAAQDQLVRTEKLRALGEMASGVAHDFNNVLASILGRAQLLVERLEDPRLRQWASVIERAAMDGARTVRRLQDFTRIRRDQPAVAVDLSEVIRQVLEVTESTWKQEAHSRGIRIEVVTSLAPGLPKVAGDPAELREALTNLVLNALDAMPRGGRLTLSSAVIGRDVQVAVADTGVGIPEGIRQKIFDPFFTTKGPAGTGLGLSMTYGILSRHGARVAVDSEEGRGTTFRITFPIPAGQVADAAEPVAAAPLPPAAFRCLVVDDEAAVRDVVGDMLIAAGQTAVVVESGPEALARVEAEPFDVVFTDLAMPGMTGWEVARAIRERAPRTRVVLVSGFGVEVSPDDMRAHGVDLVLSKPLRVQDVLGALQALRAGSGREQRGTGA
ncbi:MAG TPA: GAF domain-containing protein [Methylomirabilota bacterium]|nr:GAF domain-containing protein [Methylomirabilota bacterium]